MPRLQKLTITLLKQGVSSDDALRTTDSLTPHVVDALGVRPSLFVKSSPPNAPSWQKFLDPHLVGPLDGLFAASSSAVLFVEASSRLFAVTFGYGRYLLDTEALEQDFGLKVVLNTVAPDQLKSVDSKTIDETTVHTRRDVSRDSALSAFGLDVSRDLLRAVTGTPQGTDLGPRLTGADALGLHTRLQVPELPKLFKTLLKAHGSDSYKENGFDFIDFMRPEKSTGRLLELEARLVEALAEREITDVHLAAPETLNWIDIEGFRFSTQAAGEAPLHADPSISTYLDSRPAEDLTFAGLKRDRLQAIRVDGNQQQAWTIFQSLVYQTEVDGQLYVLSGGSWFRVDLGFRQRVYADVENLPRLASVPGAEFGTTEAAYNLLLAQSMGALCMDRRLVQDIGPDSIELCDVLTPEGGFIHVKHRGSSSTLSHLFAQGVTSAERLLQDSGFRAKARALVEKESPGFADVIPANRPDPTDYQVSFVVITRSTRDTPLTLPFFSVVNLRAAASRLRALGFHVAVAAAREPSQ